MKKTLILLCVAALGAGTISSCAKSSNGKFSGEWTISSLTTTETDTDGSGTDTEVMTVDGGMLTAVSSSTASGSTTSTINGTVPTATWTIEKDGTWTRTTDMTISITDPSYSFSSQTVATESGTWSFVGKNKTAELGKNERVVISTLVSTTAGTDIFTIGGVADTDTYTDTETYAEGENVETYLITESKSKELSLSQVGASSYSTTDSNGTTTESSTSNTAMILTQD